VTMPDLAAQGHGDGPVATRDGLATLGPEALMLRQALDQRFLRWAAEVGADPYLYPPLMRIADLDRLDYFKNFPHLAMIGSNIASASAADLSESGTPNGVVPAEQLADAAFALPSAACYNVYLDLQGRQISQLHVVTTAATCFRREDNYDGLRRLLGFYMREIVFIGERELVLHQLRAFKEKIARYLGDIGLPAKVQAASDPFFDAGGARALMSQLFPVKEEFLVDGTLAIASVNFHRNFFGERCDLRTEDGSPAFTGCVAFGVDRWMSALWARFGTDARSLCDRVRGA
jgi:hypothetical protein